MHVSHYSMTLYTVSLNYKEKLKELNLETLHEIRNTFLFILIFAEKYLD